MRKQAGWRFLPAIAGLGCLIGVAQADGTSGRTGQTNDGRSHVPVPSRGGTTDPEQLFSERLHKAKMFQDLREQVEKAFGGKKLDDLLKDLKNAGVNPNSPEFTRLLQDELKRQARGGAALKPEQLEALQRLLKDLFPDGIKPPEISIDPMPKPPGRQELPPVTGDKPPEGERPADVPKTPDWVKTPEDREALEQASQQLAQMAQRFSGWSEGVRNSQALQHALGDLARLCLENSNGRSGGLNSVLARWNQFSKHGEWLGKTWTQLRSFEMPKLPSVSLPSVHFGGPGPSLGTAASYTGAPSPLLLLGVGMAVAVWFILKRVLNRYPWGSATVAESWQPGPWPVDPAGVTSRSDLIRAFEHLSLLLLGRKAQSLNHHEIAVRIGNAEAERLAAVYERARYAPQTEPLAEQAVADFRRDLCLLAGVPGA